LILVGWVERRAPGGQRHAPARAAARSGAV